MSNHIFPYRFSSVNDNQFERLIDHRFKELYQIIEKLKNDIPKQHFYHDNGYPDESFGKDGDLYLDIKNNIYYHKKDCSWQKIYQTEPQFIPIPGPKGPTGATGPIGPMGQVLPGLTGTDTGTIIPFSSGVTLTLETLGSGVTGTIDGPSSVILLGFGNATTTNSDNGGPIELIGTDSINFAFPIPRNGVINKISGSFMVTQTDPVEFPHGSSFSINAQLFIAPQGGTTFIPSEEVNLLIGTITNINDIYYFESQDVILPVSVNDQIMMVILARSEGIAEIVFVTGYASASINII